MRSVVLLALVTSTAFAQPGATPSTEPEVPQLKSGGVAVAISVGATLGSFALASSGNELGLVGMFIGPSAGRWYNHELGGIGLAGRLVGFAVVIKGIGMVDSGGCESWYTDDECDDVEADERRGAKLVYAGLAIWGAATLYDFIEAGRGAARYNRAHALKVAPTLIDQRTPGVVLGMQF